MAPSVAAALLHLIPTRRATYNKSRKGAQRALNWPFPLASSAAKPSPSTIHPDHLAAAGFHSTPSAEQPTCSTCFLCEVVVEEWTEGDQPLEVHLELNDQCGWAVLQTILSRWAEGLREKKEWKGAWGDRGEWWPKSDYMISAREASFEKGWPHEGEKGVPTKEEIAAAGWFFAPGRDGDSDDQCICPFCTRTVEGWEEGDDPVALHKRKLGLKCPFFLAPQPVVRPIAQEDEEEEEEVAEPESVEEEPLKPKMSRSKGRTKLAQRDDDDEEEVVEEEPQPQPVRASRRIKATAPSSDGPETSVVGSAVKPSRATRGKKAPPSVVEEPEEEKEEASQSQSTRSRRSAQPEVVSEVAPKASKAKGKAVKGKKVAPPVVEEEPELEEEEAEVVEMEQDEEPIVEEPAPAPKASKKKASTRTASTASSTKSRTRTTKTKAPSKGSFVVAEDPDDEEQLADAARVAAEFLDEQEGMDVVQEEEEDAPKVKTTAIKAKKTKAAATKSKSKKAAPVEVVEDQPEEEEPAPALAPQQQQSQRGPLTPTVASPSPRPIRSLPSKVNSPAGSRSTSGSAAPLRSNSNSSTTTSSSVTTPAPISLSTPYAPPPNPFLLPSGVSLPPPTAAEMNLTLAEWYDLCGRTVYDEMEKEMEKEMKGLEDRVEEGRKELRKMIEAAKRREAASPRKMRG